VPINPFMHNVLLSYLFIALFAHLHLYEVKNACAEVFSWPKEAFYRLFNSF